MFSAIWHFILTVTGANNVSGDWYGFWSGFAGDLTIFAGIGVWYWHHVCHQNSCYRFGFHKAGDYNVCRKHHPAMKPRGSVTHTDIKEAYNKAKRSK